MVKCFFFLFLLTTSISLSASLPDKVRRIQAHLLLDDKSAALEEARQMKTAFPDELESDRMLIRTLAAVGKEQEMMNVWDSFYKQAPDEAMKRELLEDMCWGILLKGRQAPGLMTQLIALLGSAMTQQVQAVNVLKESLHHSNTHIRSVAVMLSGLYGDQPLREEIVHLFRTEKSWEVQKEVLQAIAKLKLNFLFPELLTRLSDPRLGTEEKKVIVATIVALKDKVDKEEIERLIKSERAILRMLGAECLIHRPYEGAKEVLMKLLKDSHPDVRISALKAWGWLRFPLTEDIVVATKSRNVEESITAGWTLLLLDEPQGIETLKKWLNSDQEKYRLLAIGAVCKAGKHGVELAQEVISSTKDPYIKTNAAIALLRQRVESQENAVIIDQFLQSSQEKWMWEEGFFTYLRKSTVNHHPIISDYPEVINQSVRLELLNLLCITEYPQSYEALKRFLKERKWGVTGLAAEMLLGEGDDNAVELVQEILEDPDPEICTEAALVLASWGHDVTAIPVLLKSYEKGDRQLKLKILESLGRIGDPQTIPFLIERLREPFQILRVVSACILVQILNH